MPLAWISGIARFTFLAINTRTPFEAHFAAINIRLLAIRNTVDLHAIARRTGSGLGAVGRYHAS